MIHLEALSWFVLGALVAVPLIYVQRTRNPRERAIVLLSGAFGGLLGGYGTDLVLLRSWNVRGYTVGSLIMAGLVGIMAAAVAWLMTTHERALDGDHVGPNGSSR